jgi:chemotaxis protein MotB
MDRPSIRCLLPLLSLFALTIVGCKHGRHKEHLVKAQTHARDLYAENQRLQAADAMNTQMIQGLDSERQTLMGQLGESQTQLATANDRISNLMTERGDLADRFAKAMTDSQTDGSGFNAALADSGFEYDPATGLSKFKSDILFDLGSDAIRPEANPVIGEFASAIKSGAASGLRILIVGHTDDQNIVRAETAIKHPTNWHLSTDRSDAVILELLKQGVEPTRIASMGYSEFQPLEASQSDTARKRNRRVELFVVPNNPGVANWDPATTVQ